MKSSTIFYTIVLLYLILTITVIQSQDNGLNYWYQKSFTSEEPFLQITEQSTTASNANANTNDDIEIPPEYPNTYDHAVINREASVPAPLSHDAAADDENFSNPKIPIDLLEKIQNLSVEEFLSTYVKKSKDQQPDDLANDFNGIDVARRASLVPKQAICTPLNTVVELKPNNGSSEFLYFPTCTTIKRCAGCCASSLFECQPTETQMLNFEIYRTSGYSNGRFDSVKKEIITREQHNKCACQCRTKREDCNKYQEYDPKNCACNCVNYDAHQKCDLDSKKIWVPNNCTCVCREVVVCTTGLYFNPNECVCMKIPSQPQTPELTGFPINRRQFILRPVLIDPDNNTKYNTEE